MTKTTRKTKTTIDTDQWLKTTKDIENRLVKKMKEKHTAMAKFDKEINALKTDYGKWARKKAPGYNANDPFSITSQFALMKAVAKDQVKTK
jgi:hypothetical protein